MRKKWNIIRLFYYLIKLSRDPKATSAVFGMTSCMKKLGLIQELTRKAAFSPEAVELISERKLLKKVDLRELQTLPVRTLGRAYADHMISANLNQEFYEVLDITDDDTYAIMRMRQTHDLWHVITGFNTSVAHEIGLQAFNLAQVHSPSAPIIIAGQLIASAIRNPTEAREIVNQVCRGWHMGKMASPIFALDWEANWSTPLEKLRLMYHVVTSEWSDRSVFDLAEKSSI